MVRRCYSLFSFYHAADVRKMVLPGVNDGHNIKYGYSADPLNYQTSVKVRPAKPELQ